MTYLVLDLQTWSGHISLYRQASWLHTASLKA